MPLRSDDTHSGPRIPLRSSHPTQILASHSDPRIPLRPPHPTQIPASHSDPRIPLWFLSPTRVGALRDSPFPSPTESCSRAQGLLDPQLLVLGGNHNSFLGERS